MSFIQSTKSVRGPHPIQRASRMTQKSLDSVECTYIIAIPAVGANPRKAWGDDEDQWLFRLHEEIGNAVLLRYDHLEEAERQTLSNTRESKDNSSSSRNPLKRLKTFKVEDWASRFLEALKTEILVRSYRIIFICHSTGGIVLKEALCSNRSRAYKSVSILLAFLAVPHHGSIPFSDSHILPAIQETLGLERVMGDEFMEQMQPFSDYLETLNQKFSYHSLGIPLWTYGEQKKTDLSNSEQWNAALQTRMDVTAAAGYADDAPIFVVNSESSEVKNNDYHVAADEEDWDELGTDHAGTARLADSDRYINDFINDVKEDLLKPDILREYEKNRKLLQQIFKGVNVEQYTLSPKVYKGKTVKVEVATVVKSLQAFVEQGPLRSEQVKSTPINIPIRYVVDENANLETENRQDSAALISDRREDIDKRSGQTTPKTKLSRNTVSKRTVSSSIVRPSSMPRRISRTFSESWLEEDNVPSQHQQNIVQEPELTQVPEHLMGADMEREPAEEQSLSRSRTLPARPTKAEMLRLPYLRPKTVDWYHVTHCNSSWVPLIMEVLSSRKGNTKETKKLHKQILKDPIWLDHHNNPTHDSFHGCFVHPHAQALLPKHLHSTDEMLAPSSATEEPQFALYMPYLHWDTLQAMQDRTNVVKLRTSDEAGKKVASGVRPVHNSILSNDSLEHKVMWQYLNSDMHCRRTLDQYGYPSLRNTDERDMDQVLYKYTQSIKDKMAAKSRSRLSRRSKEADQEEDQIPLAVLMVDTLWLWILSDDTIVTFAPRREDQGEPEKFSSYQADPVLAVLRSLTVERNAEVNDCFDLAALLIFHSVEALLKGSVDSNLKVFRIFEGFLSDKIEEQTASYKQFRAAQKSEKAQFDNGDDLNNLLELRDISDELEILETLLKEQERLMNHTIAIYEKKINLQQRGLVGIGLLKAAKNRLNIYIGQLEILAKNSAKAQESYDKLLNLKEAHSGVLEARVSSEQARIVNIFTIITIIFSPLSFFAGIFGMNVSDWSSVPSNPPLWYALKVTLSSSLCFTVVLLLIAFNSKARKAYNYIAELVTSYLPRGAWRLVIWGVEVKELKRKSRYEEDKEESEKLANVDVGALA